MTLNPRQRRLLEVVQSQVTISVEDLANQLDVTPQTVRRDVKLMEESLACALSRRGRVAVVGRKHRLHPTPDT